jgi:biopolymer transport protein ExbB
MKRNTKYMAGWIFAVMAIGALPAFGQDMATGAQPTTLWGLIKQGGLFMVPLGALSVAMLALAVHGFINITEEKMMRISLIPKIRAHLRQIELSDAMGLCAGHPSYLTNVLHAGLSRIAHGVFEADTMEKAMEEASIEENAAAIKPISYLSIIAQVAPMVGLLGTVAGMIGAFQKIGMGGMGDPEKLASDIGMAMVTTAAGLIIGIPSMFLYFYLKSRFTANVSRIGRVLGNLVHELQLCVSGEAPPDDALLANEKLSEDIEQTQENVEEEK